MPYSRSDLTCYQQAGETQPSLGSAGGIALCRSDEERYNAKKEQEATKGQK